MKQTKSQRICVRLTDAEREALSDQAKAMAVSESTVIREALSAFSAAEAKPGHSESGWSVTDRWG
jgi:predicted transcriptional regulator